ncbi:NADH-quinone oxidoreductase subunit NuoB [Ignisphaera sp. 4213-co]|uniref:NADH-quinone oxidoreductase subunit NuoB n=1 Tax=Ignisphaera cupida TaxID=3050454 RepID=A0ABD4Z931_9CREN|nr:NADH-quinone oxidoreductase subunit NuoB [Ignisphaera sp. 4213-co]MDK6029428.1 NADH-quinone oxidoreductase subunit NuoB [Ignisphaera sp. 4213-co]
MEFVAALTPKYDVERPGVQLVSSPRHADVLVVKGPITTLTVRPLRIIYEQIPEPKKVIAFGTCACSGGVFDGGYNVIGGVDKVIPVDVKIPGCPAHPGVLLEALAKLAGVKSSG